MLVANAVKAIGSAPVVLMLPPEPEKREGMKVPDDHLRPVEQAKASLPPAIAQFPILSARDWEFAGNPPSSRNVSAGKLKLLAVRKVASLVSRLKYSNRNTMSIWL